MFAFLSLWIAVLLPLCVGLLCVLSKGNSHRIAISGALASLIALLMSACLHQFKTIQYTTPLALYHGLGFQNTLHLNQLGWGFALTVATLFCLITAYSPIALKERSKKHAKTYYFSLALFTFFVLLWITSHNLWVIWLSWVWMGLFSYSLIGFFGNEEAPSAALHVLVWNKIGDLGFFLALVAWTHSGGGSDLDALFAAPQNHGSPALRWVCMGGWLWSALFKAAQVPAHRWLLWAMKGPTTVSAYLHSATLVACGVWWMARIYPFLIPQATLILLCVGIGSALWGAYRALQQTHVKALLAYSTIAQLGHVLILIALNARTSALIYLITHAFAKAILFLSTGIITQRLINKDGYSDKKAHALTLLNTYAHRHALPYLCATFAAVSVIGAPFTAGFVAKKYLIQALYLLPNPHIVLIAIGIAALLSALYTARLLRALWVKPPQTKPQKPFQRYEQHLSALWMGILAALAIAASYVLSANPIPLKLALPYTLLPLGVLIWALTAYFPIKQWDRITHTNASLTEKIYVPLMSATRKTSAHTHLFEAKWLAFQQKLYLKTYKSALCIQNWDVHQLAAGFAKLPQAAFRMAKSIHQHTHDQLQINLKHALTQWLIIGFAILVGYLLFAHS